MYLADMNLSVWAGAVTTLLGAIIGGTISFTLSRQQIKASQIQQESDRRQQTEQRSFERRFQVYSDFLIRARSVRNALKSYYLPSNHKPSIETIDELLHAAQDAAALVFLTLETEDTDNACVRVLRALSNAQIIIHDLNPKADNPWENLSSNLGEATRTFQNAARRELGVAGPSRPWISNVKGARPDDAGLPPDDMLDLHNKMNALAPAVARLPAMSSGARRSSSASGRSARKVSRASSHTQTPSREARRPRSVPLAATTDGGSL
jgi:hypothetical protein